MFAGVDWASEEHAVRVNDSMGGSSRVAATDTPSAGSTRCARGWSASPSSWSRSSARMGCSSIACSTPACG